MARYEKFLLFPLCFLPVLANFLLFSSNLELLNATSFSFEESEIYRFGKRLRLIKRNCRFGFGKELTCSVFSLFLSPRMKVSRRCNEPGFTYCQRCLCSSVSFPSLCGISHQDLNLQLHREAI